VNFGRIWAEINLDALHHNLEQVKRLAGRRKLMVAVKADAYGHGLHEIGEELGGKVDAFGVASVEEGKALRDAGVKDTTIIVLSPVPYDCIPDLFADRLVPSVTELEFARRVSAEAARRNLGVPVHVEVDTGMGRTGVSAESALSFIRDVAGLPGLTLAGVFTHFPSADSDIRFTESQLAAYRALLSRLEAAGIKGFLRHAANTAGILNVFESHLDMLRPGLVIYGILPESYASGRRHTDLDLKPVMSLRSRVVNLRDLPAGHSVSYERHYFTSRPSRIAVITAGYGDGYPYALTNAGKAIVRGRRASIVGNVCMDLSMLDVTDVPDVAIGDPVTLFGTENGDTITVNELASWAETIPYDIICRVSPRVPRVYIRQGRVTKVRNMLNSYAKGQ